MCMRAKVIYCPIAECMNPYECRFVETYTMYTYMYMNRSEVEHVFGNAVIYSNEANLFKLCSVRVRYFNGNTCFDELVYAFIYCS